MIFEIFIPLVAGVERMDRPMTDDERKLYYEFQQRARKEDEEHQKRCSMSFSEWKQKLMEDRKKGLL